MYSEDISKNKVRFSHEITLGDLVQVALVIVAAVGAYFAVSARIEKSEDTIEWHSKMIEKINDTQQQMAISQAQIATRLDGIASVLNKHGLDGPAPTSIDP